MTNARTHRTNQRARKLFLDELRLRGNVSDACRAAGIPRRQTVYEWRDTDPEFAQLWQEALDDAIDTMEREAHRRAFEGTKKPVIGRVGKDQDGVLTGPDGQPLYISEYSDTLAALLLKAHRPEKYRERQQVEHSGSMGVKIYERSPDFDPDSA